MAAQPKRQIYSAHPYRGLQTTTEEETTEFPALVVAQDMRVAKKVFKRRRGSVRIDRGGSDGDNLDFVAASSMHITFPTNAVHALGKEWTVEGLFSPDGVSGSQYMLGFAHATDWPIQVRMNGNQVEVVVTDTADTTDTITSTTTYSGSDKIGWQVVRNGTALTLRVNGEDEGTATMADLDCKVPSVAMYVGRDNTGNYFDGKGDYLRAFNFAKTEHVDWLTRYLDPRADHVLWDVPIQKDANELVEERSRFENRGLCVNTPTLTSSTLSHQSSPCHGVRQYRDKDDARKTFIAVGGRLFNVSL